MKGNTIIKNLVLGSFTLALMFMVVVSPAAALGIFQDDPVPPVDPDPPDIIIPDTGDQTNIFVDNWLLFVILGLIVLVLLVALVARGGGSTHHHHHE
jgi:hypothetical protein